MAKRLARLLPGYHFDEQMFFKCDNAPFDVQNLRRQAFFKIAEVLKARHPLSIQATAAARENISDMQFISAYRVPFQFSPLVQEHLKVGSFLQSATGVYVTDLDGQSFYDLTGSYGVNVFGADFYKKTMARSKDRLATDILKLFQGIKKDLNKNKKVIWVSLARAGTPIGVLLHRFAKSEGWDSIHYSVSIVRDKGLDLSAIAEIVVSHEDVSQLIFVDGWTGKGTITRELKKSVILLPSSCSSNQSAFFSSSLSIVNIGEYPIDTSDLFILSLINSLRTDLFNLS